MIDNYLVLIFGWVVYFFIHSALATSRLKDATGLSSRNYRLIYSILSSAGLLMIAYWVLRNPTVYLWKTGLITQSIAGLLLLIGIILGYLSFKPYSFLSFIGLKEDSTPNNLNKSGFYSYVRHPLYSSLLVILLGILMIKPSISVAISVAINVLYLPFGIFYEEKKLINQFGDQYLQYKQEVPAVIPDLTYSSSS